MRIFYLQSEFIRNYLKEFLFIKKKVTEEILNWKNFKFKIIILINEFCKNQRLRLCDLEDEVLQLCFPCGSEC